MKMAENDEVRVIVVRPFNLAGAGVPHSTVLGSFLRKVRERSGDPRIEVEMGDLSAFRDYIAVQDAVDAYIRLVQADAWGQIYNVCSGESVQVRSLIETLASFSPNPVHVTEPERAPNAEGVDVSVGNHEKLTEAVGWEPAVPLEQALREAWRHEFGAPA
jgi:GDP-4-dehydro-6-deoxy-D-mannose reductase